MKKSVKFLSQGAIIAALYTALTIINPWSYGPIQVRVSEALTVLPIFMPAAVPGLFVGCLISNIVGGYGIIDIIFGSLATLLAAVCTYLLRKNKPLAMLPPVIFNAVIVGGYLYILYDKTYSMFLTMTFVGIGELLSVYILGFLLTLAIEKNKKHFSKLL